MNALRHCVYISPTEFDVIHEDIELQRASLNYTIKFRDRVTNALTARWSVVRLLEQIADEEFGDLTRFEFDHRSSYASDYHMIDLLGVNDLVVNGWRVDVRCTLEKCSTVVLPYALLKTEYQPSFIIIMEALLSKPQHIQFLGCLDLRKPPSTRHLLERIDPVDQRFHLEIYKDLMTPLNQILEVIAIEAPTEQPRNRRFERCPGPNRIQKLSDDPAALSHLLLCRECSWHLARERSPASSPRGPAPTHESMEPDDAGLTLSPLLATGGGIRTRGGAAMNSRLVHLSSHRPEKRSPGKAPRSDDAISSLRGSVHQFNLSTLYLEHKRQPDKRVRALLQNEWQSLPQSNLITIYPERLEGSPSFFGNRFQIKWRLATNTLNTEVSIRIKGFPPDTENHRGEVYMVNLEHDPAQAMELLRQMLVEVETVRHVPRRLAEVGGKRGEFAIRANRNGIGQAAFELDFDANISVEQLFIILRITPRTV